MNYDKKSIGSIVSNGYKKLSKKLSKKIRTLADGDLLLFLSLTIIQVIVFTMILEGLVQLVF